MHVSTIFEGFIYLLWVVVNIASDEPSDRMAMVLPILGGVIVRYGCQLSGPDKHVGIEYDGTDGNQPHHEVIMSHILEFVPLPSEVNKDYRGYVWAV